MSVGGVCTKEKGCACACAWLVPQWTPSSTTLPYSRQYWASLERECSQTSPHSAAMPVADGRDLAEAGMRSERGGGGEGGTAQPGPTPRPPPWVAWSGVGSRRAVHGVSCMLRQRRCHSTPVLRRRLPRCVSWGVRVGRLGRPCHPHPTSAAGSVWSASGLVSSRLDLSRVTRRRRPASGSELELARGPAEIGLAGGRALLDREVKRWWSSSRCP